MPEFSVPSSSTASEVVPAAKVRDWLTIQNASLTTPVYISIDGTDPTVPGGANTGLAIDPGQTWHFARNEACPQSNLAAVKAIQTSGSAVVLRFQVAQANA